jgi:hypothetical protein
MGMWMVVTKSSCMLAVSFAGARAHTSPGARMVQHAADSAAGMHHMAAAAQQQHTEQQIPAPVWKVA